MKDLSENAFEEFKSELGALLLRIQTGQSLDGRGAQKAEALANSLSILLKHQELVPKALLNEFRTAIRILRNEAAFHPDSSRLNQFADSLEENFDRILMGEISDDRASGIPRIV